MIFLFQLIRKLPEYLHFYEIGFRKFMQNERGVIAASYLSPSYRCVYVPLESTHVTSRRSKLLQFTHIRKIVVRISDSSNLFPRGVVISSVKEPIPGWINNVYGPTGVVAAAAVGLLHVLQVDQNSKANIVPCDFVVNALIASAWNNGAK